MTDQQKDNPTQKELDAIEQERLKTEAVKKYKSDLIKTFDEHIELPKADIDRRMCADVFIKMYAQCPVEHKELLMKFTAMLMPDMQHFQNLWAKELAKLPNEEAQTSIDTIDEHLKGLSVSKIASEHHSSLYRVFIGTDHVSEKIKEYKKTELNSVNFSDNMASIIRAQAMHEYLDKTLKDKDTFQITDAKEHLRRGTTKKFELDKANGFPPVEKASAYVKIALLTQNSKCLDQAVGIAQNMSNVAEKTLVIDVIKFMREIGAAKSSYTTKFMASSDMALKKLENLG
jgi:hypothetical protein